MTKKKETRLTIILGKQIGKLRDVAGLPSAQLIYWPELTIVNIGFGLQFVPQHADEFVTQTVDLIVQLLGRGKHVQLWTQSEYLVSWITQAVGDNIIAYQQVDIRLYADDNKSFRRFGISSDGVLCSAGDGDWPFGFFMPSGNGLGL